MVVFMKNNKQRFEYVHGSWTSYIDRMLEEDWRILSITPASTKDTPGCYVLLERKDDGVDMERAAPDETNIKIEMSDMI